MQSLCIPIVTQSAYAGQQHFDHLENDDLSKEEKRELKRQVRPMARGIFLRMDKNRDGTITLGTFSSEKKIKKKSALSR